MTIHLKDGDIVLTNEEYNVYWSDFNDLKRLWPGWQVTFEEFVQARSADRLIEERNANHVDGYDRDDLGESPDY